MYNQETILREKFLTALLNKKKSLRLYYCDIYKKYESILKTCPNEGLIVELGSGVGFIKDTIPDAITTDIIGYKNIDQIVDATNMPFKNNSVKAFFMCNVLHHVFNPEKMFAEITRCLVPAGKVFIIDQYPGFLSKWIYKFLHNEPFYMHAKNWNFEETANGALAWIIFKRDLNKFNNLFPHLHIVSIKKHSLLIYWLLGGLKPWTLVPGFFYGFIKRVDFFLSEKVSKEFSSALDIQLEKKI